jgi:hypothetical protein
MQGLKEHPPSTPHDFNIFGMLKFGLPPQRNKLVASVFKSCYFHSNIDLGMTDYLF